MQEGRAIAAPGRRYRSAGVAALLLAALLCTGGDSSAQSSGALEIRRSTIDGGGGLVGSGGIGLTATLGQHDASRSVSGVIDLRGGFWAAPATIEDALFANGFE